MLGTRLRLDDHLSATATGPHGLVLQFTIRATGGDGQYLHAHVRILCPGREQGRALRTEPGGIGGILLITADDLDAVLQSDGGAHMEVGVGGIAALCGLDGELKQMLFLGGQFLGLADLNDGFQFKFFHKLR